MPAAPSDSPSFAPPSSRNSPCPCGSGRRYKDCHGALGSSAPAGTALAALLANALAAQQAGRLDEAIAGYEQALNIAPHHFDALHMLGVAHFQRGDFERALERIDQALVVLPGFPGAVYNRRLVKHGFAMRAAEDEVCREILPRLARFVVSDAAASATLPHIHLVLATRDDEPQSVDLASRAALWSGARGVQRWREAGRPVRPDAWGWPVPQARVGFVVVDPKAGRHPREGNIVIIGAERPPSAWWPECTPSSVTLVVTELVPPCLAHRIRELSGDGRRPVRLIYADANLARRCLLPGVLLEGGAA